jgi:hypothetical protein
MILIETKSRKWFEKDLRDFLLKKEKSAGLWLNLGDPNKRELPNCTYDPIYQERCEFTNISSMGYFVSSIPPEKRISCNYLISSTSW